MKQKKNLFDAGYSSVNAVEILVTKKIENDFSKTKWSHFMFFDEFVEGARFREAAHSFVDYLARTYPNMYFMEKPTTIIKSR